MVWSFTLAGVLLVLAFTVERFDSDLEATPVFLGVLAVLSFIVGLDQWVRS